MHKRLSVMLALPVSSRMGTARLCAKFVPPAHTRIRFRAPAPPHARCAVPDTGKLRLELRAASIALLEATPLGMEPQYARTAIPGLTQTKARQHA